MSDWARCTHCGLPITADTTTPIKRHLLDAHGIEPRGWRALEQHLEPDTRPDCDYQLIT